MKDNEVTRDQVEQKYARGMSNKSKISSDSPSKRYDNPIQKEEIGENTPISSLRMPDLPLPTPPPMANIMVTSRIGYRRILGRSTEFRSPILGTRSHSLDFGSRRQNMCNMDDSRNDYKSEGKNLQSLDERRYLLNAYHQELFDKNRRLNRIQRDVDPRKDQQYAKTSTFVSSKQPYRETENRANTVEFMSPLLTRAYLYHRDRVGEAGLNSHQATLTGQLGLSPLPRHKNLENLSERLEDFNEYPIYPHLQHNKSSGNSSKNDKKCKISQEQKSKYFLRDSVMSNEIEEVRTLNSELKNIYIGESTEDNINRILRSRSNSETSPEYSSLFFNEHYISDIDENEEIKEFICGYKSPERRLSDQSERSLQKSMSSKNISDDHTHLQTATLPSSFKTPSSKNCTKRSNNIHPTSNTSAFAIHNSKHTMLKNHSKCQFKTFGKNLNNSTISLDNVSASGANLTLNRTNGKRQGLTSKKNLPLSKSSDPISMHSVYSHEINHLTNTFLNSSATIPISSSHSHESSSVSSIKSSDYYSFVPLVTSGIKKVEFSADSTEKVIKSPQRTVVKLAKIRCEQEWLNIAKQFNDLWDFPNCVGAIDGKHVVLQAPINTGSEFFNYKSTFSIVLMVVVDADYCFTFADVGCQGRISDGGVIKNTSFYKKLQEDELHLPSDNALPNTNKVLPYVFVADDAFPLKKHIIKPYPSSHEKDSIDRIFNYRLSRARRIVENAFGILSVVFRVLRKPMLLEPLKSAKVALACIYLYNYLRRSTSSRNIYTRQGTFDQEIDGEIVEGSWRQEREDNTSSLLPIKKNPRKSASVFKDNRKQFAENFKTVGKVPWQDLYL